MIKLPYIHKGHAGIEFEADDAGNPLMDLIDKLLLIVTSGAETVELKTTRDAATGTVLRGRHNRPTPAVWDKVLIITGSGKDSAGNPVDYANIAFRIVDPTNGSEDGQIQFNAMNGGAWQEHFLIGAGKVQNVKEFRLLEKINANANAKPILLRRDAGDYGGGFSTYSPPTGEEGYILLAEDTNAGAPGRRLYAYSGGAWRYVDLS